MRVQNWILLLTSLASGPAVANPIAWDKVLNPNGASSYRFGVRFDGTAPYESLASQGFQPASTAKILTATLALERLGEDYRFETRAHWKTDAADPSRISELTVVGSGDPSWGLTELGESIDSRMRELAKHLHAEGVREIRGAIRFTASDQRWETEGAPPGWKESDRVACYGALPGAFNLGLNCAVFVVTGPESGRWNDSRIQDPVRVKVTHGTSTALWILREGDTFSVRGTLASGKTGTVPVPVVGVAKWLENILRSQLQKLEIRVTAEPPNEPQTEKRDYVIRSLPLKQIVQPFLKFSFNLMGEALLLKIGEASSPSSGVTLRDAGVSVVRDALVSFRVENGIQIFDGSGLSRKALATPSAFHELMVRFRELPSFPALLRSLSIAGVDGTLRNRMKGTAAARFFVGKTGSLNGVSNLVGYFPLKSGETVTDWVPVVFFGQSSVGSTVLKNGMDRAVVKLSQLHRPVSTNFISIESQGVPTSNPFESFGLSYDPRSSEGMIDGDAPKIYKDSSSDSAFPPLR